MNIVGKISVKTVVGKVPTVTVEVPKVDNGQVVLDKEQKPVMEKVQRGVKQKVMRVFGQCDRLKLGSTAYGETVGFLGMFEATNLLDGEIYRSPALYLPPVLTDMLRNEVVTAQGGELNSKDAAVQFAFDIGVDSANTPHGYQYTITPLVAASKADPLEAMRATLLANVAPPQIGNVAAPQLPLETATEGATVETAAAETKTETPAANESQKSAKKHK